MMDSLVVSLFVLVFHPNFFIKPPDTTMHRRLFLQDQLTSLLCPKLKMISKKNNDQPTTHYLFCHSHLPVNITSKIKRTLLKARN
jgi:hypothetical protein